MKEVLTKLGMKVIEEDEAFYYLYDEDGFLKEAVITHIDYFTMASNAYFLRRLKLETQRC